MTHPPTPAAESRHSLLKVLGVAFGLAIIVGNTIGTGILRTPGDVAAALPSTGWFIGVWIAGAVYSFLGAMTLAELPVMIPRSGGNYVYAHDVFGEYPGFLIGYTDWISTSAAAAAISIAIGELMGSLVPALAGRGTMVALASSAIFVVVHWIGVRSGDRTQQALSLLKTIALIGVAAACFFIPPTASGVAAAAPVSPVAPAASLPAGMAFATALILAFQSVAYTYDGWNGVVYFGGEVRDPGREVPRAMAWGVIAVAVVYFALNAAYLHVLGIQRLGTEKFALAAAANVVFGTVGERIVSIVMIVSMLGAIGAIIMQASRIPYAMAEDRLMPHWFTAVNAGGTPTRSLLLTFGVIVLLILSGTFETVIALAALFYVLQYGVNFLAVFVLRHREPDRPRAYHALGFPWVTGFVLLGATAFIVGSFVTDRVNSMHSLYVVIASVPIYFATRTLRRA